MIVLFNFPLEHKIWPFQALIASYISKDDYRTVKDITYFVLKVIVFLPFCA